MLIDTALLVLGRGPGALVVAKIASGYGLASLIAGHEPAALEHDESPVALSAAAVAELTPHGVIHVMRPFFAAVDPIWIAPAAFEEVLKQHCVVDLNVTVYDGMTLIESKPRGDGIAGVLTDGRSRWDLVADHFVDANDLPTELNAAILAGAERARSIVASLSAR